MALSANVGNTTVEKDGELVAFPMKTAVHIYKGALVCIDTSVGYALPATDAAARIFVGVATMEADNTTGQSGDIDVIVRRWGRLTLDTAGAAQTDVGKSCYVVDDCTVDLQGDVTNAVIVGQIVRYISATSVEVDIKPRYTSADDLTGLAAHVADTAGAHTSEGIDFEDTNSKTTAATVMAALDEIYGDKTSTLAEMMIPIQLFTQEDGTALTKYVAGGATPGFQQLGNKELVLTWDGFATATSIGVTIPLPPDLKGATDVIVAVNANLAGATDTPELTTEAYFDKGDTDCAGTDDELDGGVTLKEYVNTIAGVDVPASPKSLTLIMAPKAGEHGTDEVYIYSVMLRYTRKVMANS